MSKSKYGTTFDEFLEEQLRDPEFKKLWEKSEADYQIARQIIKARMKKKMSQRELAKKARTTQARISELESQSGNPTLALLKRVSAALETRIQVSV